MGFSPGVGVLAPPELSSLKGSLSGSTATRSTRRPSSVAGGAVGEGGAGEVVVASETPTRSRARSPMEAAERSGAPGDAASHVRSPVVASRIIGRGKIAAARRRRPVGCPSGTREDMQPVPRRGDARQAGHAGTRTVQRQFFQGNEGRGPESGVRCNGPDPVKQAFHFRSSRRHPQCKQGRGQPLGSPKIGPAPCSNSWRRRSVMLQALPFQCRGLGGSKDRAQSQSAPRGRRSVRHLGRIPVSNPDERPDAAYERDFLALDAPGSPEELREVDATRAEIPHPRPQG
jgi:hypothetical protein